MIKEIYENKKYGEDSFTEKVKQFAKHLYDKYPNKHKIDDKTLLDEAKTFNLNKDEIKCAVNYMLRIGDIYLMKDYLGVVK
jgi:hypothetical protein